MFRVQCSVFRVLEIVGFEGFESLKGAFRVQCSVFRVVEIGRFEGFEGFES